MRVPEDGPRKVNDRHVITLPKHVMRALRLRSGDYVDFELGKGTVRLHKVKYARVGNNR